MNRNATIYFCVALLWGCRQAAPVAPFAFAKSAVYWKDAEAFRWWDLPEPISTGFGKASAELERDGWKVRRKEPEMVCLKRNGQALFLMGGRHEAIPGSDPGFRTAIALEIRKSQVDR